MCCANARADGGRLAFSERNGNYEIAVFTSPDPLRAGPVDLSVFLQDAATHQPIANADISVVLTSRSRFPQTIRTSATSAAATNKLLRAVKFEIPDPGPWDAEIICQAEQGTVNFRFALEVKPPLPRWIAFWPWFSWPVGVAVLYGAYRLLMSRRTCAPPRPTELTRSR